MSKYETLLETHMTILNPFLWQSQGRIGLIFLIMANVGKCLNRDLTPIPGVFLFAVFFLSPCHLFPFYPHPIYS